MTLYSELFQLWRYRLSVKLTRCIPYIVRVVIHHSGAGSFNLLGLEINWWRAVKYP